MRTRIRINPIAIVLLVMLALPAGLQAQGKQLSNPENHRYQLVDLGTLGGPNSYLPLLAPYHDAVASSSLSQSGAFAGFSDTSALDPYNPFCFFDCFVSHAIAWKNGKVTDLGALPGPSGSSSAATWISKNGLIAGVSESGEIDPIIGAPVFLGVLWKNGAMVNLGTIEGGYESQANAVNSSGQVVGIASNLVADENSLWGTNTQARAFLWENGVMEDLGTLPGGSDAMAVFINEHGQIVGQSYGAESIVPPAVGCLDSPLTLYTFFWDKGQMIDIGTLGGHCANPYSLNNRGQVAGQANLPADTTSHPFLWQQGEKMKDLGTLGGTYGFAAWLNDSGNVVGSATNQDDQALLAFLWKENAMTNLGALPGNACSAADAINSSGQIVGGSGFYDASFEPACTDPVEHAVLWENGQILDLNNFVRPGTGLTLTEAYFINDRGEIGGFGTLSNGDQHAFLLIPCDDQPDAGNCGEESPAWINSANRSSIAPATAGQAMRKVPALRRSQPARTARLQTLAATGSGSSAPPDICTRCCGQCRALVALTPTSLSFPAQKVGTESSPLSVRLWNIGQENVTITSITVSGPFTQTNLCPSTLPVKAGCMIEVRFSPQEVGSATGSLSIVDNAFRSPQKVTLSGVGQ